MGFCDYCKIECEFWEPEPGRVGVGECLAVDPIVCPANDEEDVAAIREWQRRQMKADPTAEDAEDSQTRMNAD